MLFFILSAFFLFQTAFGALPICTNVTDCPPGGLWSEWASSGDGNCPTSCGSCSKILQTRKCITMNNKCPCTGESTRQYPCNTQICGYPSQRTCCIPFVSMKINGTSQCGPFAKSPDSTGCCKEGGWWSSWSGYAKMDSKNEWFRSRECLSDKGRCPCTGPEIENIGATCPCPPPADVSSATNYEAGTVPGPLGRPFEIDITDCTAFVMYNMSNFGSLRFCKPNTAGTLLLSLRAQTDANVYTTLRPTRCLDIDDTTRFRQRFTCDLQTQFWRYDMNNQAIRAITQLQYT